MFLQTVLHVVPVQLSFRSSWSIKFGNVAKTRTSSIQCFDCGKISRPWNQATQRETLYIDLMSSPVSLHKTNIVLKDTLAFHVPFMAPVLSVIVHVDVPLMAMYSIRVKPEWNRM